MSETTSAIGAAKARIVQLSYSGTPEEIKAALHAVNRSPYRSIDDLRRFSPDFQREVCRHFADMSPKEVYDAPDS